MAKRGWASYDKQPWNAIRRKGNGVLVADLAAIVGSSNNVVTARRAAGDRGGRRAGPGVDLRSPIRPHRPAVPDAAGRAPRHNRCKSLLLDDEATLIENDLIF